MCIISYCRMFEQDGRQKQGYIWWKPRISSGCVFLANGSWQIERLLSACATMRLFRLNIRFICFEKKWIPLCRNKHKRIRCLWFCFHRIFNIGTLTQKYTGENHVQSVYRPAVLFLSLLIWRIIFLRIFVLSCVFRVLRRCSLLSKNKIFIEISIVFFLSWMNYEKICCCFRI